MTKAVKRLQNSAIQCEHHNLSVRSMDDRINFLKPDHTPCGKPIDHEKNRSLYQDIESELRWKYVDSIEDIWEIIRHLEKYESASYSKDNGRERVVIRNLLVGIDCEWQPQTPMKQQRTVVNGHMQHRKLQLPCASLGDLRLGLCGLPWETSAPASADRRELKAKQRVYSRRTQHRLALTRQAGLPLPRLEELAAKFKLNRFEQNVIVMLIGKTISPVIKNLIDGVDTSPVQRMDESVTINQILSIFCDTFQEQVAHRVLFYKSSRLLTRGLVKLHRGRWHSTAGDLVDQWVELDCRLLDWVVGLDKEMNELVEGSDL
ncbi:hypothetical protein PsorP6_012888 [Peronosclerospora sorghi]|uniref:Uncharacterized protein n=1 Tax=Peronosclerospora sorghi TaxID=230839 RepID=A0ACC0WES1_9STRA|nr:hypothetical protein PsorP6_012888 [Peronosclerospora sorghi]